MRVLEALTLLTNALLLMSLIGGIIVPPREEYLWMVWLLFPFQIIAPPLSIITVLAGRAASRYPPPAGTPRSRATP
jgi:hypothetical protein